MLGKKIQQLRKSHGFSQEELASRLTLSRQAISKWELGESMPDTENVVQLSKLFGVTTDYLLNDDYECATEVTAVNVSDKAAKEGLPDQSAETTAETEQEGLPNQAAETTAETEQEGLPDQSAETIEETEQEGLPDQATETSGETSQEVLPNHQSEGPSKSLRFRRLKRNPVFWIVIAAAVIAVALGVMFISGVFPPLSNEAQELLSAPVSVERTTEEADQQEMAPLGVQNVAITYAQQEKNDITLLVGETIFLRARVEPVGAGAEIMWSSSNRNIFEFAMANTEGTAIKVTAISSGTATLTVSAGGVEAECTIRAKS